MSLAVWVLLAVLILVALAHRIGEDIASVDRAFDGESADSFVRKPLPFNVECAGWMFVRPSEERAFAIGAAWWQTFQPLAMDVDHVRERALAEAWAHAFALQVEEREASR